MNIRNILFHVARIVAALIMGQTLYFKFTGAEESIFIFTTVGMEPWGRFGVGAMELVASILLLVPAASWMGAFVGAGLMIGAIGMHLTLLGIEVKGDGGQLFVYAVIVLVCCLYVMIHKVESIRSFVTGLRR